MKDYSVKVLACLTEGGNVNTKRYNSFKSVIEMLPWVTYCKECGSIMLFTREAGIGLKQIKDQEGLTKVQFVLHCPTCSERLVTTEINIGDLYECTGLQCKCGKMINGKHDTPKCICDDCGTFKWDYRRYRVDDFFYNIDMDKLEKVVNDLIIWVKDPYDNNITIYPISVREIYNKIQNIDTSHPENNPTNDSVDAMRYAVDSFRNTWSKSWSNYLNHDLIKKLEDDTMDNIKKKYSLNFKTPPRELINLDGEKLGKEISELSDNFRKNIEQAAMLDGLIKSTPSLNIPTDSVAVEEFDGKSEDESCIREWYHIYSCYHDIQFDPNDKNETVKVYDRKTNKLIIELEMRDILHIASKVILNKRIAELRNTSVYEILGLEDA